MEEEASGYSDAQLREIVHVFKCMPRQAGYKRYLAEAEESRDKYNAALETIMHQYGCTTEAEAITGNAPYQLFFLVYV